MTFLLRVTVRWSTDDRKIVVIPERQVIPGRETIPLRERLAAGARPMSASRKSQIKLRFLAAALPPRTGRQERMRSCQCSLPSRPASQILDAEWRHAVGLAIGVDATLELDLVRHRARPCLDKGAAGPPEQPPNVHERFYSRCSDELNDRCHRSLSFTRCEGRVRRSVDSLIAPILARPSPCGDSD
jgi:hypothetical protein